MTATSHDRSLEDQGNIIALEHLNVQIDDQRLATLFYIGALGSRRTHAKRVARLTELGHGPEAMGRIHAPVGLNIEAITAPEIALSIMAEIVAARRGAALGAVRPIPGVAV